MPILLAVGFAVVAWLLRSRVFTYDALMFASAIRTGEFLPSVWRPHNLAYLPLAIGMGRLIPDPFSAGQLVSALFGGGSVGCFWLLSRRMLPAWDCALVTGLFSTTNALLAMATTVEVYTVSLFAICLVYTTVALGRRGRGWSPGVCWGFAVLGHLTNVLLFVPLAAWALVRRRDRGLLLLWMLIAGTGTVGIYTLVATQLVGVDSAAGIVAWIRSYTTGSSEYGQLGLYRLVEGVLGLKRSLVDGPAKALMIAHAAALALAIAAALVHGRLLRRLAIAPLAHATCYAAFFTWWEPTNIEFWVVTTLPLCLLMALGLRASRRSPRRRFLLRGCLLLALLVQVGFNGTRLLRHLDPAGDPWLSQARLWKDRLEPADLVVTFNDPLIFAMPLGADHDNVLGIDLEAGATEASLALALERLRMRISQSQTAGGRLYITEAALAPGELALSRLGVSPEEYRQQLRAVLAAEVEVLR